MLGLPNHTSKKSEDDPMWGLKTIAEKAPLQTTLAKYSNKFFHTFDKSFNPEKKNAYCEAFIKAAFKVGVYAKIPKGPLTTIIVGNYLSEKLQPKIENIQCFDNEHSAFAYMMTGLGSCRESKEAILRGLSLAKVPKRTLDATCDLLSQLTIKQTNRMGITDDQIQRIAGTADWLLRKVAPAQIKKIYKDWTKTPIPAKPPIHPQLIGEDLNRFNQRVVRYIEAQSDQVNIQFNDLKREFGDVFNSNQEIFQELQSVHHFFEEIKKSESERMQKEAWEHLTNQWATSFSNISQAGANLGIPILSDLGSFCQVGLSACTAISSLQALGTAAPLLQLSGPCFALGSAAFVALSLFLRKKNDSKFNKLLMETLAIISHQVENLRDEMHGRFDHIDQQLETIYRTLNAGVDILRGDLNNVAVPVLISLQEIKTSLQAIYATTNFKLDQILLSEFQDVLDKSENYMEGIIANTLLTKQENNEILRVLEKSILTTGSSSTFNGTIYADYTAEGINRLLLSKDIGHILGYLGVYAQRVLNIQDPNINVNEICNPYIFSIGVDRYLKFRTAFPNFFYDEERIKTTKILKSGKMILDFVHFLSSEPSLFEKPLDSYKKSLENLRDFIQEEGNNKIKKTFKEIGFEHPEANILTNSLVIDAQCSLTLDFLKDLRIRSVTGNTAIFPIDEALIKKFDIPIEFALAARLGIGTFEFTYGYTTSDVHRGNGWVQDLRTFKIECSFKESASNLATSLFTIDRTLDPQDNHVKLAFSTFGTDAVLRCGPSFDQTWLTGKFGKQNNASDLAEKRRSILQKIQTCLLKYRKNFAQDLIAQNPNALTAKFGILIEEVEVQTNLIKAFCRTATKRAESVSSFSQFWTKQKIREAIAGYAELASLDTKFIHDLVLVDYEIIRQSILTHARTNSLTVESEISSEDHPFLNQVKTQHQELQNFSNLVRQQQELINIMEFQIEDFNSPQDFANLSDENIALHALLEVKEVAEDVQTLKSDLSQVKQDMSDLKRSVESSFQQLFLLIQNQRT